MLFDARTLAQLRKTQRSSMMHECLIEAYAVDDSGTVSYGEPVRTVCGFSVHNVDGKLSGQQVYEQITAGAAIRLPYGTPIGMKDRITLVRSFGNPVDPVRVFEVVDFPDTFGPSGIQVEVREVYN